MNRIEIAACLRVANEHRLVELPGDRRDLRPCHSSVTGERIVARALTAGAPFKNVSLSSTETTQPARTDRWLSRARHSSSEPSGTVEWNSSDSVACKLPGGSLTCVR